MSEFDEVDSDNDREVLYALEMATEHDERHQALALRTWLPIIREWQRKAVAFDTIKGLLNDKEGRR